MTQIRFTTGDSDSLRQAASVLDDLRRQIQEKAQERETLPPGVYGALANMSETIMRLRNWADAIDTDMFRRIIQESS